MLGAALRRMANFTTPFHMVVPASGWPACCWREQGAGAGTTATGVSDRGYVGLGGAPMQARRLRSLAWLTPKIFPDTTSSTAIRCTC